MADGAETLTVFYVRFQSTAQSSIFVLQWHLFFMFRILPLNCLRFFFNIPLTVLPGLPFFITITLHIPWTHSYMFGICPLDCPCLLTYATHVSDLFWVSHAVNHLLCLSCMLAFSRETQSSLCISFPGMALLAVTSARIKSAEGQAFPDASCVTARQVNTDQWKRTDKWTKTERGKETKIQKIRIHQSPEKENREVK